jgi:phage tail protein X
MNIRHVSLGFVALCFAGMALIAATATVQDESGITHAVKRGESVSLICIQYYGHYSSGMGTAILKQNPSIKDINVIIAGQKLTLPKPVEQTASTASGTTSTASTIKATPPATTRPQETPDTSLAVLFEKKVNATQGVVTCVEGSATITPRNGQAKGKLSVNTIVYPGDVIETGTPGRVEIIINRESVLRMKENTRLTIDAFRDNATQKGKTQVGFSLGTVWAKVRKFKDSISRFELELPTAVAGVHGTVYQTSVSKDSSAEVKVYDGEVAVQNRSLESGESGTGLSEVSGPDEVPGPSEVTMEQWTEIIRAMQRMSIDKKGKPSSVQPFTKSATDWEKWNEERDKRVAEIFSE